MDLTPEQIKESEEKIAKFKERLEALQTELDVEIISFPQFVSTPTGAFHITVVTRAVDKKLIPVPSPLNNELSQ